MDILQYFSDHHDQFFYCLAGLSFIVELTVLGLGGPLLFFAIASFITGILISIGLISGWEAEVFTLGMILLLKGSSVRLSKPCEYLNSTNMFG